MKIAILAESAADRAAVQILAGHILGVPIENVEPSLEARGWPSVRNILPVVLRELHYHLEADGLIVVADANGSVPHVAAHEAAEEDDCRLCQLRKIIRTEKARLTCVAAKPALKTAVGLAIPAIEAWWRCGLEVNATESAWLQSFKSARDSKPARLKLKRDVYGTDRPSLEMETRRMGEEVRRLCVDVSSLEKNFPHGFGSLARDLRSW